ncbi:MAG: GDSL-type esterase/lipase family protein [bacterium]
MHIHDQIEFHNTAELVPLAHPAGLALYRYSRAAIEHLSVLGQHAAACSDGVELRFVTGSSWVNLTLSALSRFPWSTGANISVFRGDIPVSDHLIADGATQTLRLAAPALQDQMGLGAFTDRLFARDLWRIVVSGATVIYHGLETGGQPVRPPRPDEKPELRWLAYGSSITNSVPGYVHHCARYLRADVLNKGLCGSCACEPETGRFLAVCGEWDFATLELGVNMRGWTTAEVFEQRVRMLIQELRNTSAESPIVLITMFPTFEDYLATPDGMTGINRAFRDVLRRVHGDSRDPNLHLIEGDRVLTSYTALSADLLHPSPNGHHLMGHNLAAVLRPILKLQPEQAQRHGAADCAGAQLYNPGREHPAWKNGGA